MQLTLRLALPRDASSVPVVRGVLTESLESLGVEQECVQDIRVAVSEACTNVLDHVQEGDAFEVVASIDESFCALEVIDRGTGFDGSKVGHLVDDDAETGRGLRLMRALVDNIRFERRAKGGAVVFMEKELQWRPGAAPRRLGDGPAEPARRARPEPDLA